MPDLCEVEGECRSHDEEKLARVTAAMIDAMQAGAAQTGVDVDIALVHEYRGVRPHRALAGGPPEQGRA